MESGAGSGADALGRERVYSRNRSSFVIESLLFHVFEIFEALNRIHLYGCLAAQVEGYWDQLMNLSALVVDH